MRIQTKILIVDDKVENLYALEQILKRLDVVVIQALSGFEALELILEHDFSLALIDVQMPEMDGYELVTLLRGNQSTAELPIIFVSAIYSDEYYHHKGYESGAVDFISKPFSPEILLSKVRVFIELYEQKQQLHQLVTQLNTSNHTLEKRTELLDACSQISRQITTSLDVEELLPNIVQSIQKKFGYYFVGIWMWDHLNEKIVLEVREGMYPDQLTPLGIELPANSPGIIVHAGKTGETYCSNDVYTDPNFLASDEQYDTQAELALPLQIGTTILGVLDIQHNKTQAFSKDETLILRTLADQMAIAIRNAQLHEQTLLFNRELENKVRLRTRELEQANYNLEQMDGKKSDFIGVISHELRTPIMLINGYNELIRKSPLIQDSDLVHLVEGTRTGVQRIQQIVNSMFDVTSIENDLIHLHYEEINLAELLSQFIENISSQLDDRQLTFVLIELQKLPSISGDLGALTKMFQHLIGNAIKYTPDEGEITISGLVMTKELDKKPQECIQITITDTGIGIDPRFRELIFTKFFQTGEVAFHSSGTTKFKGGGPGLGLTIAQGIAQAHGGHIWVESEKQDEETCPGSRFHILLPIQPPSPSTQKVARPSLNR